MYIIINRNYQTLIFIELMEKFIFIYFIQNPEVNLWEERICM